MTRAVRFSRGYVRARMLKGRLWTALDRPMLLRAGIDPDGHRVTGAPRDVFPPLVRWYVVLNRAYPAAQPIFMALLRLHEIENLKLLWRAAVRGRALAVGAWRPLGPLAALSSDLRRDSPDALVDGLARTPYGPIARALVRSHGADLPATEIGLDRWALAAIRDHARALAPRERAASALLLSVVRERDVDLLSRGLSFGLDADLVAKSTVVLSRESGVGALTELVRWRPSAGPLWRALPPALIRLTGPVETWDAAIEALRRARLRACRRAFVGWPYQLAPALAVLLLREEQGRAVTSIAAAARSDVGRTVLPQALAAGLLGE